MGYVIPSDPLLRFAFYSGLGVFLLTMALLLAIALLRYTIDRRERRERALTERWQPVFFHAIEGIPIEAPRVFGRDRETVLMVWIHFTESIRGEARQRLRELALGLQLEGTALKMLGRRSIQSQLMAIVALGRLESAVAWDSLAGLVASPNPMASLLAARSLLQIDAARAVPIMLEAFSHRNDWPMTKVAAMLGEVPAEVLSPPLLAKLQAAAAEEKPSLLSLLETTNHGDVWALLAPLLEQDQPAEVLVAALKACQDPRSLDATRLLTTHAKWIVRAQAAMTLSRFGVEEDRYRLQAMLGDPKWWVRYRAAKSLASLPFTQRKKLEAMCAALTDRFAADILAQVLAETAPSEPA